MFRNRRFLKKGRSLVFAILIMFMMSGCSGYVSSYKAAGFVHSNGSSSAFMTFYSFEGRMVFRLKSKGETDLKYRASLESGDITVYYDCYGTKTELFTVKDGEEIDSSGGYAEEGTVYIIVETNGKCRNGELRFELE